MEIGDFPAPTTVSPPQSWWERLTVADGLFVCVLVLGAIMRFANLGRIPLSNVEAELALAVWRFWQPVSDSITVSSPAYFTLTSLVTQILGFSDATMRLIPALFGLGVVYLPWLLRERLGSAGALVACLLLAVSPLNTAVSRTVGGDAIALFAVLLLLVAMVRYRDTAVTTWLYIIAGAIGLGLASAALFYTGLATLAAAWAILRLFKLSPFAEKIVLPDTPTRRNALIIGVSIFAASSSFLLWYPAGFGASAQILGDWLAQFGINNGRPLIDPYLALVRYEPALLFMGGVAILWAVWRNHVLALAFVYWLLAGLVFMLIQAGVMNNTLLLTLSGYLLIGLLAQSALHPQPANRFTWLTAVAIFFWLILLVVNTGRFLRVIAFNPGEIQYLLIIILGFLLVAMVLYVLMAFDVTAVLQGIFIGFLAYFVLIMWGTGWWLGHQAANDPRERWVESGTDGDIRLMQNALHSFSRQFTNSDTELDIASSVDTPVLRWYLRDFRNAQLGNTLPPTAVNAILITPDQTEPLIGQSYTGSDFGLTLTKAASTSVPLDLNQWVETLRWWLFHDSPTLPLNERVILWVRADLTQ